jgi:hypothetical protein
MTDSILLKEVPDYCGGTPVAHRSVERTLLLRRYPCCTSFSRAYSTPAAVLLLRIDFDEVHSDLLLLLERYD